MRWLIIAGALLIAGLLGAFVQGARQERAQQARLDSLADEVREVAKLVRQVPVAVPAPPAGPVRIDDGQIEGIAGQLATRLAGRTSTPVAQPVKKTGDEPEAPRELTAAQREAGEQAGKIVEQVIGRGTLEAEDVAALRPVISRLPIGEQDAVRLRLVRAINRQELKIDPRTGLP